MQDALRFGLVLMVSLAACAPPGVGDKVGVVGTSGRGAPKPHPTPRRRPTVTPTPLGTVVFGGIGAAGLLGDGWRLRARRWHRLPSEGAPSPRTGHVAAWTGNRYCVWGGEDRASLRADGACWTPGAPRWIAMPMARAPAPRRDATALVVGDDGWIFGGVDGAGAIAGGARFVVESARWEPAPNLPAMGVDVGRVAVAPGASEVLLGVPRELDSCDWELWSFGSEPAVARGDVATQGPCGVRGAAFDGGLLRLGDDGDDVFSWSSRTWLRAGPGVLRGRWGEAVAEVPEGLVLWAGRDAQGVRADGWRFDARTLTFEALPSAGADLARFDAVPITDGSGALLLWGADDDGLRDDAATLR